MEEHLKRDAKNPKKEPAFQKAVQIVAYEDFSFLLTENGRVFSWGREDDHDKFKGFLGRSTRPKSSKNMKSNLTGENNPLSHRKPCILNKLVHFRVKRISAENGKFCAYLHDFGGEMMTPMPEDAAHQHLDP